MLEKIKNLIQSFLRLLYINKCIVCNKNSENFLCNKCKKEIIFLSLKPIKLYKSTEIYCVSLYENIVKKIIKSLKFYRKKSASVVLAQLLYEYFLKLEKNKKYTIIYPPTFFSKNIRRGYCHMELIAQNFSKLTNMEIEKNLIKKIKYTKPQYKSKNRKKNIENSFEINKNLIEKYKNTSLLLIDDITTTSATIDTLIDILKDAGINDVMCLVIAKAGK